MQDAASNLKLLLLEIEHFADSNFERILVLHHLSIAWSNDKEVDLIISCQSGELIYSKSDKEINRDIYAMEDILPKRPNIKNTRIYNNTNNNEPIVYLVPYDVVGDIDTKDDSNVDDNVINKFTNLDDFNTTADIKNTISDPDGYCHNILSSTNPSNLKPIEDFNDCLTNSNLTNKGSMNFKNIKYDNPKEKLNYCNRIDNSDSYDVIASSRNIGANANLVRLKRKVRCSQKNQNKSPHVHSEFSDRDSYIIDKYANLEKDSIKEEDYMQKLLAEEYNSKRTVNKRQYIYKGPFVCLRCDKKFNCRSIFYKHKGLVHPNESISTLLGRPRTYKRIYKITNKMHVKTVFKCEFCSMSTTHRSRFEIHVRKHTKERPYLCNICGRGFNTNESVRMHLRTHTGEKPYMCDVCTKQFRHKGTLRIHSRIHTGERPFSCRHCDKSFIDKTAILRHEKTHDKHLKRSKNKLEKTLNDGLHFQCSDCAKSFKFQKGLRRHQELSHNFNGNDCVQSSIDNFQFANISLSKNHLPIFLNDAEKAPFPHCKKQNVAPVLHRRQTSNSVENIPIVAYAECDVAPIINQSECVAPIVDQSEYIAPIVDQPECVAPIIDQSEIEPLAFEEIPSGDGAVIMTTDDLDYDYIQFKIESAVFDDFDGHIIEPIAFEEIS